MSRIGELMRAELDGTNEADPLVIARRVLMQLEADEREDALVETLRDRARIEIGRHRMLLTHRSQGKSRWERHHMVSAKRVCVRGEWKLLADCSADDLDAVAEDHEVRAEKERALAQMYRVYAAEMRSAGAATFAELAVEVAA